MAIITAGDLDGDGDIDLMIGKDNNSINSYENIGTVSAPIWTVKSSWDIQLQYIGKPALGDLDNDGDLDLVAGGMGTVQVYKNTGDSSIPVWTSYSGWNIPGAPTYDCRPVLVDLDNDGDLDLLWSSMAYGSKLCYLREYWHANQSYRLFIPDGILLLTVMLRQRLLIWIMMGFLSLL